MLVLGRVGCGTCPGIPLELGLSSGARGVVVPKSCSGVDVGAFEAGSLLLLVLAVLLAVLLVPVLLVPLVLT